ncbi:MAG: hypothetical protein ACFLMY_04950 [Candidatus Brachytrichaceae bacterium NZ_4S206]
MVADIVQHVSDDGAHALAPPALGQPVAPAKQHTLRVELLRSRVVAQSGGIHLQTAHGCAGVLIRHEARVVAFADALRPEGRPAVAQAGAVFGRAVVAHPVARDVALELGEDREDADVGSQQRADAARRVYRPVCRDEGDAVVLA